MLLGVAGLLPPLIAIVGEVLLHSSSDREPSAFMLATPAIGYAAIILSFLGGTWWGMAAVDPAASRRRRWLVLAVTPSLVAAGAFLSGWVAPLPWGAAIVVALGLVTSLLGDRALVRAGLAPAWWMRLRMPLSIVLAAETIAVAALT